MGVISKSEFEIIFSQHHKSSDIDEFYLCVNNILELAHKEYNIQTSKACFDIAGPINNDRTYAKTTNLDLGISISELRNKTMLHNILLINDFEAIGFGVTLLDRVDEHQIITLHHTAGFTQNAVPKATIAVLGAGTGLGMSILTYDHEKDLYIPHPSEGGHVDFAPKDQLEIQLVDYLKEKVTGGSHPGFERVVSGQGITNIYNFLREIRYERPTDITKMIDALPDKRKPAQIQKHTYNSITCKKAIDMFIEFYARAARNLALTALAKGGIYIAGGIAPRMIDCLKDKRFMQEFEKNDKQASILKEIPVYVVMDYNISLIGCCNAIVNFSDKL